MSSVKNYLVSFFAICAIVGTTKAAFSHHFQSTPYYTIAEKNFHVGDVFKMPLFTSELKDQMAQKIVNEPYINYEVPPTHQNQPYFTPELMSLISPQITNRLENFKPDLPPGYVSLPAMIDVPPGYQLYSNKFTYY